MVLKIFFYVILFSSPGWGQVLFPSPLSPRIANYRISARLLPESKRVEGSCRLTWHNMSRDTIDHLQFHMYLNAFKNERSLFMIEENRRRGRRVSSLADSSEWGWVELDKIRTTDGRLLSWQFLSPVEAPDDETVIRIDLPFKVKPGDSLAIDYSFTSKLPRLVARTGYGDDEFFMIGQWFPKIGVWENGRWNCHPFHAYSEFYSDFGVYELELSVPDRFVVGANGVLINQITRNGATTYRFRQEDVIDAVWTAFPFYSVDSQVVQSGSRTVKISYLLAPGREENMHQYRSVSEAMFETMSAMMGPYPYSDLTIVDVPEGEVASAGGMEYPTLITTGTLPNTGLVQWLENLRWLEIVTFHEFAHQYCQSMVATNEFEEPWLDEGLTSYLEHRMLEAYALHKNMARAWDPCSDSLFNHSIITGTVIFTTRVTVP